MNTIALAFRNIVRNPRRSGSAIAAIAIGMSAILMFGGYVNHIQFALETNYVRQGGQFEIIKRGYLDFGMANPGQYGIENYEEIVSQLKGDKTLAPMLSVVSTSLSLTGLGGNSDAGVSRTVIADGVVVEDVNQMRKWNDYGLPEKYKQSELTGTSSDSVFVGKGVARVLLICDQLQVANCAKPPAEVADATAKTLPTDIGDLAQGSQPAAAGQKSDAPQMELLTSSARGAPNVAKLKVVKASNMGVKEVDDMYVGMHLSQAQKLVYGAAPPRVTSIILQLHHSEDMPAVRARVNQLLETTLKGRSLEIRDFKEISPNYDQTVNLFMAVLGLIFILIAAIVLFMVGSTTATSVVERTTEIGTLRSMGVKRRGIKWMFVSEGLLLGAIGAAAGCVLALVLAFVVNRLDLSWTPPGATEAVPLALKVWGDWAMLLSTSIDILIVALVSAWLPAVRAARMNIVDALRHV